MKKNLKKVLSLVFSLVMLISFTACGGPSAEDTLKSGLDALKSGDQSYFNNSLSTVENDFDDIDKKDTEKALKTIFSTMDYEIVSSNEEGNKATVKVKITNKDYSKAIEKYFSDAMTYIFSNLDASDSEIDAKMVELLLNAIDNTSKGDASVTNEVDFTLTKGDNGWVIDKPSDDAINAIYGNMVKGLEDLQSSLK